MKKILMAMLLGLAMLFTGCVTQEELNACKATGIIDGIEGVEIQTVFNYEPITSVDDFATAYIHNLGLSKDDYKVKLDKVQPGWVHVLIYKGKKDVLEFPIYFDKDSYGYVPTYMISSKKHKDVLEKTLNQFRR